MQKDSAYNSQNFSIFLLYIPIIIFVMILLIYQLRFGIKDKATEKRFTSNQSETILELDNSR